MSDNKNTPPVEEEEEKKDIEIVTGNGKDLHISPVYDHVKIDKPEMSNNKNKKIVVPKSSNK